MARESLMQPLGTAAARFTLTDTRTGNRVTLEDFAAAPALLVAFLCNHCPYVQHLLPAFVSFAREYSARGLAVVAISSNDVSSHPADAPDEMARLAKAQGFSFPYLFDATQEVAKAYHAVCTPDFFLFDRERHLAYRGQFDASRPRSSTPVSGSELRAAVDALLEGRAAPTQQIASIGCSIKWKAGQEPGWA
jgi:peroxiredoxin